jgi:molybdenum cofactor cytidylyltransferase
VKDLLRDKSMGLPLLIVAAGKSRRFGLADKRFTVLPHGGLLINALVRRGRKAGLDVHVVIDADDDVSAQIDAPCLKVAQASLGMGSSIANGVSLLAEHSTASAILIMPVDLPLLRVASLISVAAAAGSAQLVIPRFNGQAGHPVAFGRAFWSQLQSLSGESGARSVVSAALPAQRQFLELSDEGVIADADTEAEMIALLAKLKPRLRAE